MVWTVVASEIQLSINIATAPFHSFLEDLFQKAYTTINHTRLDQKLLKL